MATSNELDLKKLQGHMADMQRAYDATKNELEKANSNEVKIRNEFIVEGGRKLPKTHEARIKFEEANKARELAMSNHRISIDNIDDAYDAILAFEHQNYSENEYQLALKYNDIVIHRGNHLLCINYDEDHDSVRVTSAQNGKNDIDMYLKNVEQIHELIEGLKDIASKMETIQKNKAWDKNS